jgi:uracil-DNA glycosylase family 4
MPLELDDRQRAMLQEMGVHVWLPAPQQSAPAPVLAAPVAKAMPPSTAPTAAPPSPAAPRKIAPVDAQGDPLGLAAMEWQALADAASSCQACGLCAGRKNATLLAPPQPLQADWMVVGDPPDEDEDRAAQPFVEQAGVLLDNMLKAVGVSRTGVGVAGAYLTNVVKCRPPQGRIAQPAELAQCAAYLQREIALVQPKVIVAMGRFSTQLVLGEKPELSTLPLGKLRGTVYRYQGVAVVVTYHPKVLLRASADKAKAWADLCLAVQAL